MAQINQINQADRIDNQESKRTPRRSAGRPLNVSVLEELRSLKQALQDSL
jgi:hypothetical protein